MRLDLNCEEVAVCVTALVALRGKNVLHPKKIDALLDRCTDFLIRWSAERPENLAPLALVTAMCKLQDVVAGRSITNEKTDTTSGELDEGRLSDR